MAIYKLLDGISIAATSKDDFVAKLRNSSFFPCEDVHAYMAEFAKRVFVLYSTNVRSDSEENFVDDLLEMKIIRILELN